MLTYTVTPRVYGACDHTPVTATVWVNPEPEIRASIADTLACSNEPTLISVSRPNNVVGGRWMYDLKVIPDPLVTGNTVDGTYTDPVDLTETLVNADREIRKVVYKFRPYITLDDGTTICTGPEQIVRIWVHPQIVYDYKQQDISCYGLRDASIRINISPALGPYKFSWTGPDGFTDDKRNISRLAAGIYNLTIIDRNDCPAYHTFTITEPEKIEIEMDLSLSKDGAYNIDCDGGATGFINASASNTVGPAKFRWSNGMSGTQITGLTAGDYRLIVTDANNCQASSTATLTDPEPIKIRYEVISPYCVGKPDGEIRLSVSGGVPLVPLPENNPENAYLFMWSDNSTGKDLRNILPGTYQVTVTDFNGCTETATIVVESPRENCLVIPEAISVNDDGINDVWNIGNMDLYPNAEVVIYNQWGQELWRSERGYPRPWDGTSRGRRLPVDGYHYVIDLHNGSKLIAGSITIVK
jgi:gliding motility-associated-like protein